MGFLRLNLVLLHFQFWIKVNFQEKVVIKLGCSSGFDQKCGFMRTLNINAKKKTDFINESRFWKFSKMRIFSDFRKMCADRGPKMRTNPHKRGRMSSLHQAFNMLFFALFKQ